ncbi:MAG: poly-beta-1,6-N-acetyl-D-glucosamine N-deacetylase PgaB [Nitrospirota bacterium]|nr:poly-beta-1,6-N-acetyl-D-glucosamine N-deacetylase PgaB [Nitrospirota bacterium]
MPDGQTADAADGDLLVLNYHEVVTRPEDASGDIYAVTTASLAAQLDWLRGNGWTPVSVDQVLDARSGKKALPPRAVLLTFDDGYAGFYTQVFPLLRLFGYPAVLAVVGEWMETPAGGTVDYGGVPTPRQRFVTWEQLRQMQDSGLVEVASHSYALHRGILANPQGNELPAAVAARFDPASGRYEEAAAQVRRVRQDLERSRELIARNTRRAPRVLVWPYGMSGGAVEQAAKEAGFALQMGLTHGVNHFAGAGAGTSTDAARPLRRILIQGDPGLGAWVHDLRHATDVHPRRVLHVDLDYVYDPDPAVREANLGKLLERVKSLGVTTVYLQAFADPDGDGAADAVYFPNRHLPVRADLFGRAAWQLKTRTGVTVYAWMPVLAFHPPEGIPAGASGADAGAREVAALPHADGKTPRHQPYHRLSPFDSGVRAWIGDLYEDLARHAAFDGLLFHDDAVLTDFEDASPAALAFYREQWHLAGDVAAIRADADQFARWSRLKSEFLTGFTDELTQRARVWRGSLATARNLYAPVALDAGSEAWFAQSLPLFLNHYDYTAVMAMPYMEQADHPERWLRKVVAAVAAHPGGLEKTVFELQSVDWRNGQPIPATTLARQLALLAAGGARHMGYYPDDFPRGLPQAGPLQPLLSTRSQPEAP